MKKFILTTTFLFQLVTALTSTNAQTDKSDKFPESPELKKVGQAGYTFLKIGVDARASGLGEASVTMENDAATLFLNPAGITSIARNSVFLGYTTWIADVQKTAAAFARNLGQWGHIAVSAAFMDYNSIEGTEIDPFDPMGYRDIGNIGLQEYVIGLTYGRRFTDRFGLGITAKYCSQDLQAKSSNVIAFDVGTIYDLRWHGIKIGMSILHFARNMKYIEETYRLPLTFNIGATIDVLSAANLENDLHQWCFFIAANNPIDYSERVHLGTEYWYKNMVALRCGYKFNYDEEGVTFGGGIRYDGFDLNYSYADFGRFLGSVNRLSMSFNF
ncbi:MAG: PorV/PorQ family protein [candidate division KSB1 bacterium]|nr:PorV/PorQ family protein [candidate division KSB1 bacterium]